MATGTVVVTDRFQTAQVRKISVAWTATAGGVVVTDNLGPLTGLLVSVSTIPTAGANAYNLQIRRGGATTAFFDMLNANGASQSATLPLEPHPVDGNGNAICAPMCMDDVFGMIDGAASGQTGTFVLLFVQP